MSTQRYYDIVKLVGGSLTLDFPAYDTSVNNKIIRFEPETKTIKISETHALGIVTDSVLERMYRAGYFKVLPEAEFLAEVEKKFYPIEPPKTISNEEILTYLRKNNRKAIRDLVEDNPVAVSNVVNVAREHIDELSQSAIRFLNELLEVELVLEE